MLSSLFSLFYVTGECLSRFLLQSVTRLGKGLVRDSLPYRTPLYPPCAGHVILRPCPFGSLMCVVLCVWAKSLLVPSPFTLSMLTS